MNDQDPEPRLFGTVLVVDDEEPILLIWTRVLRDTGLRVLTQSDPLAAMAVLEAERADVVVLDFQMPGKDGLTLLREIKAAHPGVEAVMQTGFGTIEVAVDAMRAGAYDFLQKPLEDLDLMRRTVMRAVDRKRLADRNRELEAQVSFRAEYEGMVGGGAAMKKVFETVETVAFSTSSVLIGGESGTGKELVARALHFRSPRRDGPFVPVNCAAITETLLESELFGHLRGAFTGATQNKRGLFEAADHGTIFLDEISEVPQSIQVKLLRVLQEGELRRVGSSDTMRVDVRVVAATNRDLAAAVSGGAFREDLYYRLNVINVALPPLRDRRDDIPVLVHHFLRRFSGKMQKKVVSVDDRAMRALSAYGWPGNIRELENVVERAVVLCKGDSVTPGDLPAQITEPGAERHSRAAAIPESAPAGKYRDAKAAAMARFERAYFRGLLERTGGQIGEAARLAGLDRSNFRKLLGKHPDVRKKPGEEPDSEAKEPHAKPI
ncbi:MAG: sigma-54-dependent Fis family transcriptional regulator [Deltaproteobacteria bacterium]|nr:sigma-54-dependent Fis family transcriptional regulator [Deltaproteobacteria bacterium]